MLRSNPLPPVGHEMKKKEIFFISGLLSNESVWKYQIESLGGRAITKVVSPTEETPQKMLDKILKEAPDRFVLIGHSMGGWLAMEVMRKAKDRVSSLCLLNTTARSDSPEKRNKRLELISRAQKGEFPSIVRELVDNFVVVPSAKKEVEKMFFEVGVDAFIRQEKSMLSREEFESILPTISCPTLVIHAEKDKLFSLDDHQNIVNKIPNAKLEIVENSGHMSPLEMPDKVNSFLKKWIETIP